MSKSIFLSFLLAAVLHAEIHSLTLRQAVETALKQNPEIAMARLDEIKAHAAARAARDPFLPRITVGSGLAYSNGFPMSIEGSAPSVVQAAAQQFLFNREQSYQVAQAKEDARGAAIAVSARRDEIAFRSASLYLDAERALRLSGLARQAVAGRQTVLDAVTAQVREGRALPLAQKQAELAVARARQLAEDADADQATAETTLALALGFPAEDRVRAIRQDRPAPELPRTEDQAIESALESNQELRRLESQIISKQLELRGEKAARLPRADLVAQYAMLAKFNNYAEFFNHFQRNNGEVGVAFQVPLFRPGVASATLQTDAEINRLKIELSNTRNRLSADLQQAFRAVHKAQTASSVAGLDLEVAREQLSVDLAQFEEGRLPLRDLEEARASESDKWMAFYDAQYELEKARWSVLRFTGTLVASVEALN